MAGETIKSEAICIDIRPWSRTSHVVTWLTPLGKVSTVVKGAVRPKSAFLGQYDLNYTCELLYYASARGELHALRECVPVDMREALRADYRALTLAGYFRRLVLDLAPAGPDCRQWYDLLSSSLSSLVPGADDSPSLVHLFVVFELKALELSGLSPDFSNYDRTAEWSDFVIESGTFSSGGGRCVRVARAVAEYLARPCGRIKNPRIPLDAARLIGVFYQFHLDCPSDVRRAVLSVISENQGR